MILNIYKDLGKTPLESIELARTKLGIDPDTPIAFAGRLDPLAEGVLIALVGDEAKRQAQYLSLDKEYEAQILLAISTDTYDVLGLPTSIDDKELNKSEIIQELESFTGKLSLPYPPYSSKTIDGVPLWTLARKNKLEGIKLPTRESEVYKIEEVNLTSIEQSQVLDEVLRKISLVNGDFRQSQIARAWHDLGLIKGKLQLLSATISCSSGTYIRSLAHTLGQNLGSKALLYSLKRTKVGSYYIKDSIKV